MPARTAPFPRPTGSAAVAASPSLAVRSLGRQFNGRWAFRGVTFARTGPGVIGLRGANGSGKTSLLRIVAQLLLPTEGTVTVDGIALDDARGGTARGRVGMVPHAPLAYAGVSVRDNLRFAARLGGSTRRGSSALVDASLERWGLLDVADTVARELSRGWQQRYAFARADLHEPPVLLLDEPTTGLDTAGRDLLDAAVASWRDRRLVLVSSHEGDWLDACADQQVALETPVAGAWDDGYDDGFEHEFDDDTDALDDRA